MSEYEANDCLKNINYVDRNDRELSRYQLYVDINSHSKNPVQMKDILSLPWDNVFLNESEFTYNEEDKKILDDKADSFADMLNKGTLNLNEEVKI